MKKFREIYKPHMLRPILYSVFSKFIMSLCAILLWDRFINVKNTVQYGILDFAFFIVGIYLLMWAWLKYLSLDGMEFKVFKQMSNLFKKRKKFYAHGDMADFLDEKVVTMDELDDDERTAAQMMADILAGLLFLIPSIISIMI